MKKLASECLKVTSPSIGSQPTLRSRPAGLAGEFTIRISPVLQFILEKPRADQSLIYFVECRKRGLEADERDVMQYIGSNFNLIAAAETFPDLTEEQLITLLNDEMVNARPEEERICATLRFYGIDCTSECPLP